MSTLIEPDGIAFSIIRQYTPEGTPLQVTKFNNRNIMVRFTREVRKASNWNATTRVSAHIDPTSTGFRVRLDGVMVGEDSLDPADRFHTTEEDAIAAAIAFLVTR